MKEYTRLTEIRDDILHGKITCHGLVQHYLNQIHEKRHLNTFIEVYEAEALEQAALLDEKFRLNNQGKLAGLVISLKDVLCHKDHEVTASSKILRGFKSQFTATAIQRLLDEDAIVIGRVSCDEFAMGSSNENAYYGPVCNPHNPKKVPGGSSGASAVSVAAGMCHASIGSDTGGSVRQPSAFCGTFGLKPTYSRVSRYGLIAYGSSFDCIGPITKSVEDAALLLHFMSGHDEYDSTSSSKPKTAPELTASSRKLKIGVLKESFNEAIQQEIRAALQFEVDKLKQAGHEVQEVTFPLLDYLLPTYYVLTTAEASSNLARYDGVKFGYRSPNSGYLEDMYKNTRTEGFGKEVQKRIMLGTFVLSADYYDAYFTKAQKARRQIQDATNKLFETFDIILMPTTPTTAFNIGEKSKDSLTMYLADIFTVQANISGNPAISVPVGKDVEGMPIGIQAIARPFEEETMLAFANLLV